MFCSQFSLLFPLAFVIHLASSCQIDGSLIQCSPKNLTREPGKLYEWPEWCEEFNGDLNLGLIDLKTANFKNLQKISGRLSLISTPYHRMPQMPNLKIIEISNGPGVVILNNRNLSDMRGFVNWDKEIKIQGTGSDEFPVFISGNRELDTVNLSKLFHKPSSPIACEKRLKPNYDSHFAEGLSLSLVLIIIILQSTIMLYPLSMGDSNVYFVPGYHKSI
ncbi:unnamed protein product [Caenorhabditis nigoni]